MSKIRQMRELRDEGFTLIELLIVIVVLGILAGIVVFGVGTFRSDSQAAACNADMKTISVAADAWNAKYGKYEEVDASGATTGVQLTVQDLVDAKYLKSAPAAADDNPTLNATGVVTPGAAAPPGCNPYPAP